MKTSNLTFAEGLLGIQSEQASRKGNKQMVFDWDKAAEIISKRLAHDPDLKAEAGLEGDWDYTGGTIFEAGKPADDYTYLSSNWATPTLIINDREEIPCYTADEDTRFGSDSKWDEQSLAILNRKVLPL